MPAREADGPGSAVTLGLGKLEDAHAVGVRLRESVQRAQVYRDPMMTLCSLKTMRGCVERQRSAESREKRADPSSLLEASGSSRAFCNDSLRFLEHGAGVHDSLRFSPPVGG